MSNEHFRLPNIRKLFKPDPGYVIFDADLKGADGQVVAWEADDKELKQWLSDGTDMHIKHGVEVGGETRLLSLDPDSHLYYELRQSYKHATHGVHYGASEYALARHPAIGWPVAKAGRYISNYFKRRPGVLEWHRRTAHNLKTKRMAENKFGYRIIYFDRVEGLLPQALAWVPQSTVALTCFKGAIKLRNAMPFVEILLQVHDSLVFQVPFRHAERYEEILHHLSVEIPYPDPLVIPWGLAKSEVSWGDCQKIKLKKAA